MKPIAFLLLFTLCGLLASHADNPPSADTKIFLDSIVNAEDAKAPVTVTEWFISPQTLQKLPACDPEKGDLPLSVKAATAIAHDNLNKNVKAPEKWSMDSVELLQIDEGDSGVTVPDIFAPKKTGKWFFKITFSRPVSNEDLDTKTYATDYQVYVLMDGSLSETRTRPQTKQEIDSDKSIAESITKAAKENSK